NLLSSIGGFIQAVGFAIFVLDIVLHVRIGKVTSRNPWNAGTLEWALAKPPPPYNLASIPTVSNREPLWEDPKLPAQIAAGEHWLGSTQQEGRQTMGVEVITGEPQCVVLLPGPSWLPLSCGIATAAFFLSVLFKLYLMSAAAAAIALGLFAFWAWTRSPREPEALIEVRPGVHLPPHTACPQAPGWWGTVAAIAADATILASPIFGGWFLRLYAPNWPPPEWMSIPTWSVIVMSIAILLLGWSGRRSATSGSLRDAMLRPTLWI